MKKLLFFLFSSILLTGCATVSYSPDDIKRASLPGVYHEVKRGETLWSISKTYNIDLKKVISANRLPDASKIEVGQLIFIPEGPAKAKRESGFKVNNLENFMWPVRGAVIAYFGSTTEMSKNKGIDIEARRGLKIVASRSGKVSFVSEGLEGYGKTIIMDHSEDFQTVYAHNSENLVHLDQLIKQGDVIAKVGDTGRTDKAKLHFEIRKKHKPQNPFYYLP